MLFTTYCQMQCERFHCQTARKIPIGYGMHFSAILNNYSGMTSYICRRFISTTAFLVLVMCEDGHTKLMRPTVSFSFIGYSTFRCIWRIWQMGNNCRRKAKMDDIKRTCPNTPLMLAANCLFICSVWRRPAGQQVVPWCLIYRDSRRSGRRELLARRPTISSVPPNGTCRRLIIRRQHVVHTSAILTFAAAAGRPSVANRRRASVTSSMATDDGMAAVSRWWRLTSLCRALQQLPVHAVTKIIAYYRRQSRPSPTMPQHRPQSW